MAGQLTLVWVAAVIIGFLVLNQGSKLLTDNAVFVARRFGQSRYVVGVLLVSTLAALPEVLVSALALEQGSPGIAVGNALASMVVTLGLVIGMAAIICPIRTSKEIPIRDAVLLAGFSLVACFFLLDGLLSSYEGTVLVVLFVPYVLNLLIAQKTAPKEELEETVRDLKIELAMTGWLFGRKVEIRAGPRWLVFGVLWAVIGAQFIVHGAIQLSSTLGISPWVLGITVVAFGTSLPDVVASFHASKKGYSDLAIGEGIGANIVTLLLTLGIIGLLQSTSVDISLMLPMIIAMVGSSLVLLGFLASGESMGKKAGILMLFIYLITVVTSVVFFTNGDGGPFT